MSFVGLKDLALQYGSHKVVQGIKLQIEQGEFISLLGPSGCGKTTTLRMTAGFLSPSGGEIRVGGRVLSAPGRVVPPEHRRMSMIFQSYAIWPHMTVFENVAYGLRVHRVPGSEVKRRVERMLDVVKLGHLAQRYPAELSGGQQQRVALARALVVEPEILLLDEPLSNLDASLREEMRFEIRRLHEEFRITTIYVTHDQAMVTSDRIAVMNHGRIEQIGTPEDVYQRPASVFAASFLGRTNLIPGQMTGQGEVLTASGPVSVESGEGAPVSGRVVLAIRPHDIGLLPVGAASRFPPGDEAPGSGRPLNRLEGIVSRGTYLGDANDYSVTLPHGDLRLRVTTGPHTRFQPGEPVQVAFAPQRCRVLPEGESA